MEGLSKFKAVIAELIELFDQLSETETKKLKAVVDNNLKTLEECMKEEQASILKLKVLEKKREDVQVELGLQGQSFKEIISGLSDEAKSEMEESYQKLEASLSNFNKHADSTKTAIETNLYSIDNILESLKAHGKNKGKEGFQSKKV